MIPAGKYEYTIKGKLGTKKGIIDFKEVGKNVTGVMYFGKYGCEINGNTDSKKIRFWGNYLTKFKNHFINVKHCPMKENGFEGEIEFGTKKKAISAVKIDDATPVPADAVVTAKAEKAEKAEG
jgi:hypothetical protein